MADEKQSRNITTILTFLVPSLLGVLLFMTPISYNNELTIPVAVLAGELKNLLNDYLTSIICAIVVFTATASVLVKLLRPGFIRRSKFLNSLLNISCLALGQGFGRHIYLSDLLPGWP